MTKIVAQNDNLGSFHINILKMASCCGFVVRNQRDEVSRVNNNKRKKSNDKIKVTTIIFTDLGKH